MSSTHCLRYRRSLLQTSGALGLPKLQCAYIVHIDACSWQLGWYFSRAAQQTRWTHFYCMIDNRRGSRPWSYSPRGSCNDPTILLLRSFLESIQFIIQTEQNALNGMLYLGSATGNFARCRLQLSKEAFNVSYCNENKTQVVDIWSPLITSLGGPYFILRRTTCHFGRFPTAKDGTIYTEIIKIIEQYDYKRFIFIFLESTAMCIVVAP